MEHCGAGAHGAPWFMIKDEQMCKQAANTLALVWGETWDGRHKPAGCVKDNYGERMIYFNRRNKTHINIIKSQYDAICAKIRGQY